MDNYSIIIPYSSILLSPQDRPPALASVASKHEQAPSETGPDSEASVQPAGSLEQFGGAART